MPGRPARQCASSDCSWWAVVGSPYCQHHGGPVPPMKDAEQREAKLRADYEFYAHNHVSPSDVEGLRAPAKVETVDHPVHYNQHPSGVECIDIVEHMTFNVGSAVKYCWRAGLKGDALIEDLEKARWYLAREIERLKKGKS